MPRVSICIPSYKPKHFEICLASAVAQTFMDTEIIVSDDCPADDIRQICEKFPKVQYSRNPNPGARNNLLRLLSLAQGEYIKVLLDDDILHPFCVQYLLQTLESSKSHNTRLAFSPRGTIDTNNILTGTINFLNIAGPGASIMNGPQAIALMASNCLNFVGEFSTVMFRKADVERLPGHSLLDFPHTDTRALGDVAAWINLAEMGNIAIHPETLSYFRQHAGANSDQAANPEFILAVTEWELIVGYAQDRGYLRGDNLSKAYQSLLRIFRSWIHAFPELNASIHRVEQQLASMAA